MLAQPHVPEWKFLMPQQQSLTPSAMANILEQYGAGSPWGDAAYVARVKALGFAPLQGYFEGIVDLLGQFPNQRWVLVDYKSNRLGDGYEPKHIEQAMADCHYLLQALLYAVAVKRWLTLAVSGWDYNKHFAGAAYLFLRGLKAGSSQGVWFGKPPKALVDELGKLICEGGRRRHERNRTEQR
jgi:exodeoxyribonuclease V beta subunit